jgi:hypothetical protein
MPQLPSQNATLAISDMGTAPTFAPIAFTYSITQTDPGANEIEVSHLTSTEKEFLSGLPDPGSWDIGMWYDPDQATHDTLRALRSSGDPNDFRLTFTDATPSTWTFSATVRAFAIRLATDAAIDSTVTLRASGAIVEA